MYAAKMLHYLIRALLLSVACAGLVLAWLCCWIDRFRSGKSATSWIISTQLSRKKTETERCGPVAVAEAYQPLKLNVNQPRTIDSMIRNKERRVSFLSAE
jgi:hypothetical protein